MSMRNFQVTLTGKTPLLMHHDNIDWADFMEDWKNDPANKKLSKAGDDRSPAWRWLGCVYHDGKTVAIPQSNIMKSLMEGGAMVLVPGGKNGKTFKSQTQSGMMSVEPYWQLLINGKPIEWKAVEALKSEPKFADHKVRARDLGFELLVKRAAVGASKHVRVRPQFAAGWKAVGSIAVWDEQIDDKSLASIFEYAGQYKGIGDWRPGAPKKPGPYGTFEAEIS
jgi:hypothetical protein